MGGDASPKAPSLLLLLAMQYYSLDIFYYLENGFANNSVGSRPFCSSNGSFGYDVLINNPIDMEKFYLFLILVMHFSGLLTLESINAQLLLRGIATTFYWWGTNKYKMPTAIWSAVKSNSPTYAIHIIKNANLPK